VSFLCVHLDACSGRVGEEGRDGEGGEWVGWRADSGVELSRNLGLAIQGSINIRSGSFSCCMSVALLIRLKPWSTMILSIGRSWRTSRYTSSASWLGDC